MKMFLVFTLTLISFTAFAEITPSRGTFDPRIRIVTYNPHDVVLITTYYGVSTDVEFSEDEVIGTPEPGDPNAWDIRTVGRHMFLRPIAPEADTNLTVVSDKRVYRFYLRVLPVPLTDVKQTKDPNLIYGLSFKYPDLDAARAAQLRAKEEAEQRERLLKSKLLAGDPSAAINEDYWIAGSEQISPTAVSDDGRFIRLTFGKNRDMPAIYEVDENGKESLINGVPKGNTFTVQRLVRKLVLRKGDLVVCVVNKSFSFDGKDNTTGTVSPDVERVIKGEK